MMIAAMATSLAWVGRGAWLKGGLMTGLHPSETRTQGRSSLYHYTRWGIERRLCLE